MHLSKVKTLKVIRPQTAPGEVRLASYYVWKLPLLNALGKNGFRNLKQQETKYYSY
jgi:hypothetical protein